jgi:hypothetical protein
MNDAGLILSVDAVSKKNIPTAEIPLLISKLLGQYYLLESPALKPALFASPRVQGLQQVLNLEVCCIHLSRL